MCKHTMRYRCCFAISSHLFIDGENKRREKTELFQEQFGMSFQKKYLQAYHLLTGSLQAAYEHGFQTVIPYCLSEFIFLTTGLLSDAIPKAKCTYCVSADPRNESCYHVQYHVNTSLPLVSRKTEKNEIKFLLIHFKCKECVKSLPRSQVSFMPQQWRSKMCFLSFTLSERSAEVWGQDWCQINNFTVLNFLKVEAPDKTTAVCTQYALWSHGMIDDKSKQILFIQL